MSDDTITSLTRDVEVLQLVLNQLHTQTMPDQSKNLVARALAKVNSIAQQVDSSEGHSRLAALYEVSQTLGTSLDLEEVLNQVMDSAIHLTGAERGFLVLVEDGLENPVVRVGRNMEQQTLEEDKMRVSRTVIRTVAESGEGILATNAQSDPRFSEQESVLMYSLRSIICTPLLSRDQVIGVIYVDNRVKEGLFEEDDLTLLNAFAAQAAAAIQNANLFTQTDRSHAARVHELESLAWISRELNYQKTLEEVLKVCRDWALENTSAEDVWIAVEVDDEHGLPVMQVGAGAKPGRLINPQDEVLRGVLEGHTPHIFAAGNGQPARLVVPVLSREGLLGVLGAEWPDQVPPEAMQMVSRLANQMALGFEKMRLYERIIEEREKQAAFVSIMTHELRLPMTSIMGYSDLLKQGALGPVNEQQMEFLSVIRTNVGRMSTLVSDLSDISKADHGRIHLDPARIHLEDVIAAAVDAKQKDLNERQQSLDIQVAPGLKSYADANRTQQVIKYLLDNASSYAPHGSRISLQARPVDRTARVEISDQGPGIDPGDQPFVFDEFFRSEREHIRAVNGWGLGLTAAQKLVSLMGGEIGFDTAPGTGSTFWFTLPLES